MWPTAVSTLSDVLCYMIKYYMTATDTAQRALTLFHLQNQQLRSVAENGGEVWMIRAEVLLKDFDHSQKQRARFVMLALKVCRNVKGERSRLAEQRSSHNDASLSPQSFTGH